MSIRSNVDARRFDQGITVQRKVQTQDGATGEITFTWSDVVKLWACVDAVKANERYQAGQELSGGEYTVWIRWRDDLDPSMRIVWGSRILDIKGIPDNQKRGRLLSLFCQTGINDG